MLASAGGSLAVAAACLAAVSVALVTWFGFAQPGDPQGAAWVYLVYAACAIVGAARDRRAVVAWAGAALLLAAVVQGVMFRYAAHWQLVHPELMAIFVYATLAVAVALALRCVPLAVAASPLEGVFWTAGFFASLAGPAWLVWLAPTHTAAFEAPYWLWLAAIWLTVAIGTAWLPVFALAQIAVAIAIIFGVGTILERQPWFAETRFPWLDPWTLQAVGTALAGACLAWAVARYAVTRLSARDANSRLSRAAALLASPWLSVDRAIAGSLVGLLLLVATYAAWPGTLQEIAPRPATAQLVAASSSSTQAPAIALREVPPISDFAIPHLAHAHAGQAGSWVLLSMLLLLVIALALERRSGPWLLAVLVVAAAVMPLVACRFESQVAVASGLRWTSALWIVVLSLPIWFRRWLPAVTARLSPVTLGGPTLPNQATTLVFLLGLIAPLVIGLQIAAMAPGSLARSREPWRESRRADDRGHGRAACCRNLLGRRPAILCAPRRLLRSVWQPVSSALVILLGAAPLAAVAVQSLSLALVRHPIVGPEPGSLFDRMGLSASYSLPILALALAILGYAIVERSSLLALAPVCWAMPPRPPPICCTCQPASWCSIVINGSAWRSSTRSWRPAVRWPGWRRSPGRGAIVNRASRSRSIFPASRNWCSRLRSCCCCSAGPGASWWFIRRAGRPSRRWSTPSWSMPGAG